MSDQSMWLVQLVTWERARLNAKAQERHAAEETKRYIHKLIGSGMELDDILEYLEDHEDG